MVRPRWLFVLSCIALVTSAFTFVVRGDVLQALGDHFQFTQEQKGAFEGAVFLGMAISMLGGGFICDLLGMKRIMWLAFASHIIGALGTILMGEMDLSGSQDNSTVFAVLYGLSFLMGCGNGFTEVAINPLVATLYPLRKTHYLNVLHAWWPGGLVIGGLLARTVGGGLDLGFFQMDGFNLNWQGSLFLIVVPAVIYGLMLLPSIFPATERVEAGVSTREMFMACLRPLFFLWAFCMLLTASTELGPQKWQESVMMSVTGGHVSGTLLLVYTSGMMFVLRHFAGTIVLRISPVWMMAGSAFLSAIGLYLLSFANNTASAFGYATIFGLGIAYFWPTMLGVTAERFPKGGALALALMGSFGNLAVSQVLPQMGGIVDRYAVIAMQDESPELQQEMLKRNDEGEAVALNPDELNALDVEIVDQLIAIQREDPATAQQIVANEQVYVKLEEAAAQATPKLGDLTTRALARGALDRGAIDQLAATNDDVVVLQDLLVRRDPVRGAEAYGFSMAFRWVSTLPVVLVFLFVGIALYDTSRGGYKPELLISDKEEAELMTGGVEGPIE